MTRVLAIAVLVLGFGALQFASAQNVANGKKVYTEYCKTCHQDNGQGLGTVYPPLSKSDYIKKTDKTTLLREIIFGKSGKVKVNGKEYNGVMTPLPSKYTEQNIADVVSYVFASFGNSKGNVSIADVKAAKKKGKLK